MYMIVGHDEGAELRQERESEQSVWGIMNIYIWRLDICTLHLDFSYAGYSYCDTIFNRFCDLWLSERSNPFFLPSFLLAVLFDMTGTWGGEEAGVLGSQLCLYTFFGGAREETPDRREGGCTERMR